MLVANLVPILERHIDQVRGRPGSARIVHKDLDRAESGTTSSKDRVTSTDHSARPPGFLIGSADSVSAFFPRSGMKMLAPAIEKRRASVRPKHARHQRQEAELTRRTVTRLTSARTPV
jgi:hypothetical protein